MDDNLKVLSGIAMKLLYKDKTLETMKGLVVGGQSPTEAIAKILATVLRQAVADAQKAGAKMSNQTVMGALMVLAKEAVEIIQKNGNMDKKQASTVAKTLIAATTKVLGEMTSIPQGGQPQQAAPQPAGLVAQQMGAA